LSTQTTKFAWKDRDTAARDMLQLAYYAPESIRRRALQLLEVFCSPVILPELKQIVMDETRDIWERRYAIRAIASIPGDIYLPEFSQFESTHDRWRSLSFEDFLSLGSKHPSNLQWLFHNIEQLKPQAYIEELSRSTIYFHEGLDLNPIICQRIRDVIDQNPLLLNIDLINTLHGSDQSEVNLKWLHERWDTIIYLCLTTKMDESFFLLEDWGGLREAVFEKRPSIIEEYEQKKQDIEILRAEHQLATVDYQSSPIWQELNGWYHAALEDDREAYKKLVHVVKSGRGDLSRRAVATNLLGKLRHKYDVRKPLLYALRYAPDDMNYQHRSMDASIRFEAGEALRDIPSPDVWEAMVDSFFIRPRNVLESFMSDWIAYLTDRLSGLDVPYSGMQYSDEDHRFWFRGLVDVDTSQQQNKETASL
jgi:hypothetical protein